MNPSELPRRSQLDLGFAKHEDLSFLEAARLVLEDVRSPLNSAEITRIALSRGWIETEGETPRRSMDARISTNIRRFRDRSPFKRVAKGLFALRDWTQWGEYDPPERSRRPLEEEILVVDRDVVESLSIEGFCPEYDLLTHLLADAYPYSRRDAEVDPTKKQLIGYIVVRFGDKVFAYKRSKRLPEGRLHGMWSVGFGGHIQVDDQAPLFYTNTAYFIETLVRREIEEELEIGAPFQIIPLGLLNDNSDEVGRLHIGLVCELRLQDSSVSVKERGYEISASFFSREELQQNKWIELEQWSKVLVGASLF